MRLCGVSQGLIGALLLGAALANGYASRGAQPYSGTHPKRVLVQHLHLLGPRGNVQARPLSPSEHALLLADCCHGFPIETLPLHGQNSVLHAESDVCSVFW